MDAVLDAAEAERLRDLAPRIEALGEGRAALIPMLQLVQEALAYLPAEAIRLVARRLGLSASEVFGVASFYNQFRFSPPGRHPIKVCLGTACHVRGGAIILENFERRLAIREGETTADREFSIDRVACVGCCALAPVALVGDTVHGKMQPSKVEGIVLRVQVERQKRERERRGHDPGPAGEDPAAAI
jgi:NADH-quinone oxidoreductase subunit E